MSDKPRQTEPPKSQNYSYFSHLQGGVLENQVKTSADYGLMSGMQYEKIMQLKESKPTTSQYTTTSTSK